MTRVRCAIYTRKSSEEGLEQDFNSLDAQYEACAAYVLSQASEGWTLLPERYDDGGLSGGTLERPALRRLLADVAAGRIDIIVVYKVDRLTRSLLDFAKLVEALDANGTSFVSVTQSFNTTTSMGRLTLNMLLSFAQFEREVTAERIRDKIAASKAKGMWMGGTPPLGYRPDGRTLAIVEEHATLVRDIFARYLATGNVRIVAEQLVSEGVSSPVRTSGTGRRFGGRSFTRGQLYFMLRNPIYVGDIGHRGKVHTGQHPAIIPRAMWEDAQRLLANHIRGERRVTSSTTSLLAGRIVDADCEPLVAAHASKKGVRYRYYVSRALQHEGRASEMPGMRLPAREIEAAVAEQVAVLLDDPVGLATRLHVTLSLATIARISERCADTAAALRRRNHDGLSDLITQVRVLSSRLEIDVPAARLAQRLEVEPDTPLSPMLILSAPMRITRTGHSIRMISSDGSAAGVAEPDATLVRLLVQARKWWRILAGGGIDVTRLAAREGVTKSYVTRIIRLAFLAPDVVEAMLDARQRATLDGAALKKSDAISPLWAEQRVAFLPAERVLQC